MINLLTPEIRKRLKHEEHQREVIVTLWLLFGLFFIALVLNLALWLNFRIQTQTIIINNSPSLEEPISKQFIDDKLVSEQVERLLTWWPKRTWFDVLTELQALKSGAIRIGRLVGEIRGNNLVLAIAGEASNRQELAKFADQLKNNKFFSRVDLPLNDLLAGEKSRFTLNLEIVNHD